MLSIYFATKIDRNSSEKFTSCISVVRRGEREAKRRQRKVKRMCQLVRKLYAPCAAGIVPCFRPGFLAVGCTPSPHLSLSFSVSFCFICTYNIEEAVIKWPALSLARCYAYLPVHLYFSFRTAVRNAGKG